MADQNITIKLTIDGSGQLKKATTDTEKLAKATDKNTSAQKRNKKQSEEVIKGQKGIHQSNLSSAKGFSKMNQMLEGGGGSSGLVAAYATLAANVFAATAAFNAFRQAAAFQQLGEGFTFMANQAGRTMDLVVERLKEVTGNALSTEQALQGASLAISAGFNTEDLDKLAKVARGASLALGRNLADAFDRLTRGAIKLEPEILDELGIIVRLDDATEAYAASIGKTANELTQFQRQQAFVNAINEQGIEKYGELADAVDVNPYDQLAAAFGDLTKTGLNVLNVFLTPLVKLFAGSSAALTGGIILFGSTILTTMIPALGNMAKTASEAADNALDFANANAEAVDQDIETAKETLQSGKKRTKTVRDLNKAVREGGDIQAQAIKTERNLKKQLATADRNLAAAKASGDKQAIAAAEVRQQQIQEEIAATQVLKTADSSRLNQAIAAEAARTAAVQARIVADGAAAIAQAGVIGGFKIAAASVREYAASVNFAGAATSGFRKLLNRLIATLGLGKVAAKLFGAAFLNAIPILGQALFVIGLLTTAFGFLKGKFKDTGAGQQTLSKITEELSNKFDQLNDSVAKLGENATKGAIGIRTLQMSAGIFTEIAGAIAQINAEAENAAKTRIDQIADQDFGPRRAARLAGRLEEFDKEQGEKAAGKVRSRGLKELKSTLTEIADDTSLASLELQAELIKQFDAKFGADSVSNAGGLRQFIRSLKPDNFDDVSEALAKGSATINAYDQSLKNLGRSLTEGEAIFSKFFDKAVKSTKFDDIVKQFNSLEDSITELSDRPDELLEKFEKMGTQLSKFKLEGETTQEFIDRVPDLAEAFEKVQKKAQTLADDLARVKVETEALKGVSNLTALGTTAFLEKQREGIELQRTFAQDQIDIYKTMEETPGILAEIRRLEIERDKLSTQMKTDVEITAAAKITELEVSKNLLGLEEKIAKANREKALSQAKFNKLVSTGSSTLSPTQERRLTVAAAKEEFDFKQKSAKIEADLLDARFKLFVLEQKSLFDQKKISVDLLAQSVAAAFQVKELQKEGAQAQVNAAAETLRLTSAQGLASGDVFTIAETLLDLTGEAAETSGGKFNLAAAAMEPFIDNLKELGPEGQATAGAIQSILDLTGQLVGFEDRVKDLTATFDKLFEDNEDLDFLTKMGITPEKLAKTVVALEVLSGVLNMFAQTAKMAAETQIAAVQRQIDQEKKLDGTSKASMERIKALEKKKEGIERKAFERDKKLRIAQAAIAGAVGAVQAFTAMAALGPIGLKIGAVLAASIMAMTAKQISMIKAQQFDGGGASTGGGTPSAISVGDRSNRVDVAQSANAGELAFLRGEAGIGSTANNFTPGGAAGMRRGYQTGGEILVGEQGPEVIQPTATGFNVVPNDRLGGGTSNINFTINAVDAAGVQEVLEAQRGNIIGMIREAAHDHGEEFLEPVDTSAYGGTDTNAGAGGYG